ncbi:MAG TPA: MMPL family transporter, partial [Steroidobacteraceae bacterium]|nr:MMPL family transporter [Steroidobacteraceae bacterium]
MVGRSVARAWLLVAVVIILCAAMAQYVRGHFAMTTDTHVLLSPKLPWRVRQTALNATFPQQSPDIVVVVDGRTPELSETGASALAASLSADTTLFRSVQQPDDGPFWARNRLLFASTEDVKKITAQIVKVQPFLGSMASDPSLRGLANTLSLIAKGVNSGETSVQDLRTPLRILADALEGLTTGHRPFFSWRTLITGSEPDERELRHIVLVDPRLDFTQLQPGKLPIDAIRSVAQRLQLDQAHGLRVRLTGPVPLQDEEFATLAQRAGLIAVLASAAIILMLWFAVRSALLIAAILATTLVGLLTATALGLALFQRYNVISVAFIPLFVGMGMDLGIQFSVRYRTERASGEEVGPALIATGRTMGKSLTLAAAAIGAGFLAFTPTAYYGVSQLGVIAGLGMFTALGLNLTLLPALIALTRAPGVPLRPGTRLAMIDDYVLGHRVLVVGSGAAAALICAALLPLVRFDFNPIHLRSATVGSVATLVDLMHDPDRSPNTLEVIRPSLAAADELAAVFRRNPTVHSARTLSSFIPADQAQKIALIADTANLVDFTLNPLEVATPPTDAELSDSLQRAAGKLRQISTQDPALRADTQRLAAALDTLARGTPAARAAAVQMLIPGFATTLGQIRSFLQPQPVSIATLPPDTVRAWQSADGHARVSVLPQGNSNDDAVLRRFTAAGLKLAPDAAGTAIYLQAYARAVVDAFIEAGVLSFVAICGLLLLALKRVRDVAITMAPIVLTGLLTMGTCVLIGQPLNFANIIALPLLFGIGVAFDIYFVMWWREGGRNLLQSPLTRAVLMSAGTTGAAFGTLSLSRHPG